jgi:hypothetical protein
MKIPPRNSGVYELLRSRIDLAQLVGQFAELEDHGSTKVCFCPLNEQSSGNSGFKIYDEGGCRELLASSARYPE